MVSYGVRWVGVAEPTLGGRLVAVPRLEETNQITGEIGPDSGSLPGRRETIYEQLKRLWFTRLVDKVPSNDDGPRQTFFSFRKAL